MTRVGVALALASSACSPSSDAPKPSRAAVHDRAALAVTRIAGSAGHADLVYDGAHLVKQTLVLDGSGTASTAAYDYDGDRIVRETFTNVDPAYTRTTTYAYDGDRLTRLTVARMGMADTTVVYAYDPDGALTSITEADGVVYTYTCDDLGRLVTIASSAGTWRFGYDDAGRLVKLADGAGDHYTLAYDGAGRVSLVTSDEGQRFDLSYDDQGHLARSVAQLGLPEPETFTYTYGPGTVVNMSLQPPLDGNYELRHFVDLAGRSFARPDPQQLQPNL